MDYTVLRLEFKFKLNRSPLKNLQPTGPCQGQRSAEGSAGK